MTTATTSEDRRAAATTPPAEPRTVDPAATNVLQTEAARPIFAIGALRSGSSLLALSLGQHPRIVPVPDSGWLERFAVDLHQTYREALWQPDTSLLQMAGMEIEDFCAYFGESVNRLILGGTDPSAGALTHHIPPSGNGAVADAGPRTGDRPRRWVDGAGGHCFDVFPIFRLFPLAKFIHVVRDVDEVVASLINEENRALYKSRHLLMTEQDAFEHWIDATTAALEAERAFGSETVLRVHRRDLIDAPEATLRRCLAFLDEPFDAACLRPFRPSTASDRPSTLPFPGGAVSVRSCPPSVRADAERLSDLLRAEGAPAFPRDDLAVARLEVAFTERNEREPQGGATRLDRQPVRSTTGSSALTRPKMSPLSVRGLVAQWRDRVFKAGVPSTPATASGRSVPKRDPFLDKLQRTIRYDGFEAAERLVVTEQAQRWSKLATLTKRTDPERALDYAERSFALDPRPATARRIAQLAQTGHRIVFPEAMLRYYVDAKGEDATPHDLRQLDFLRGWKNLLLNGFPVPPKLPSPTIEPMPGKIFYCLHNSLPHSSAGYAMRSHGLLGGLAKSDANVLTYTRYGYPWDLREHRKAQVRPDFPVEDNVDGIIYRRLRTLDAGWQQIPIDKYIDGYANQIESIARTERPSVLHAASNFVVGLATVTAARRLGIPVLYEVRGLWEVTHLSRDPAWSGTEQHQAYVRLETQAAVEADRVIAITHALKEELIARGVSPAKIIVVPNSVETSRFTPEPRDRELEQRLGLQHKRVVGYVGSFLQYEGLDDLLHVTNLLVQQGTDFRLLLVGDGAEMPRLERLVSELGLEEVVILTGRVPFDEVPRYYSLIDIAPFPRKPLPVTEMVSPLKPFEAMAMEKAVLVSSVAALKEIVIDGETGLVFEKGDWASMAEQLGLLVRDPELCSRLGRNARQWVMQHRSWERAAADVAELYRELQATRLA